MGKKKKKRVRNKKRRPVMEYGQALRGLHIRVDEDRQNGSNNS